ncbi:MAG: tetratricopeptide repeat protein, partial [Thermoanaerobaculia bacterium]|nr:tetratricopeptide repeat protein [Thermoanaerobaculia bacterium]
MKDNEPMGMKALKLATLAVLCIALASCTSFRAWENAKQYEQLGEWDKAVLEYERALEIDPDNLQYRMALQRAKLEASRLHFERGKELMSAGHYKMAALEFQITVKMDPTNQFAAVELAKAIAAAEEQSQESYRDIEEMKRRVTEQSKPPMLNPASNQPISLSFPKETNVKDIYRALGNAFGVNVMFDQRLTDDKISIELRNVTAQEALERVMQAATHFYKVLDEETIIVIPDNAQTRREYEDLVIRTFYLSNGDAEQVTNVVRTMIEARNVFPLKALNAITIRDTADKVLIAERIIEANDKARAEVVVQVELLQVDTNKMRDIGLILGKDSIETGFFNEEGESITSLPWDEVSDLGQNNLFVNIPSATYKLVKTASEATLLAKPQLRISEGEAATLHIGQQVPIAVTTYNSIINQPGQGGNIYAPPTSYQYRDVGIKISIEPRVHHNREITLKLSVEVSNIQSFIGEGAVEQPIIGTRTIESTIRLKDGETNFLAGLIRKDENDADRDIPFLSDLPLLGRLFSNTSREDRSTDLILTMTPHIIRIADITEDDL